MDIGSIVKVVRATTMSQLKLEGQTAKIIAKTGAVFFAVTTESGIEFEFDVEGRMGLTVRKYSRKDKASEYRDQLDKVTKEFENFKNEILKDINSLENFESDEEYEKEQSKQLV